MKKNPYPGKFIVFDALDGSGQTTQIDKLADFLKKKKIKVYLTKEPTSNLIGGLIRSQLSHEWKSSPECLQLLFAADRAHHLEKEIIPILKKGVVVICDRYFFSSFAYGALELNQNWLFKINEHFLLPDLTFFLKVSARVCIERIKETRYELTLFEKEKLLEKVWRNYQKIAKKFENIEIIDGEKSINDVSKEIIKIVNQTLKL